MPEIILPLHLLSLLFVMWNVIKADQLGFSWIHGKVQILEANKVITYHRYTWIGLSLMITTGFLLFIPMKEYLLTRPQFYVKMAFVITLICNGFIIGNLQKTATTKTYASLSLREKAPLFISGTISTICWLGAIAGGFFLIPE